MDNKIATVVWNEFIAQTANNGINFSFTDLEKRIKETIDEALSQPPVSGELNCEHDWLVDMYDHFGFPASRFCDKCSTREAI